MDNLALSQGGSLCFNSSALANGTNAGTIRTTATLNYTVDGRFYSKAATDNIAVAVSLPATYGVATNGAFTGGSGGSVRLYGIYIDSAGAISYHPGPVCDATLLAAGQAALQFPSNRKGRACLGVMRVQVNSGVTFVPGTNALSGNASNTGLVTYLNLSALPGEPLTA